MPVRKQKRRVPETAERVRDPVGVPREDRRVQDRIAEATGDGVRRRERERPRRDERRRDEQP